MDFTAIDFEKANNHPGSACSVGLAVVVDGKVVDTYSSMIRPPDMNFLPRFVRLHHITPERVSRAPKFEDVWPEIQSRCASGLIAAHNAASCDVPVLITCAQHSGLGPLPEQYFCTLKLARSFLPGLPNHKLPTLAELLGIPLKQHDAGSDAWVCAELAIKLERLAGPDKLARHCCSIADFRRSGRTSHGPSEDPVILSMGERKVEHAGRGGYTAQLVERASPDGRFQAQVFVFTGDLAFLRREDACAIVESQGGSTSGAVSRKTSYLVVADDALNVYERTRKASTKLKKAIQVQEGGGCVRVISGSEFLKMIQ